MAVVESADSEVVVLFGVPLNILVAVCGRCLKNSRCFCGSICGGGRLWHIDESWGVHLEESGLCSKG